MTPFKLDSDVQGGGVVLHLAGELDVASAPRLRDEVVRLISEGRTTITFDCSELAFVDSTGLGVLIGARARCLAANGSVSLTGVRPALQRLLAVTGIESLFLTAA
jgi:anti-sigma B factor antagonist